MDDILIKSGRYGRLEVDHGAIDNPSLAIAGLVQVGQLGECRPNALQRQQDKGFVQLTLEILPVQVRPRWFN